MVWIRNHIYLFIHWIGDNDMIELSRVVKNKESKYGCLVGNS